MEKGFDYVIQNHSTTLAVLARQYKWLTFSWEDLYHDLVIYVVERLETYKGKMTNMNSLVTLLARRSINDKVKTFYNRKEKVRYVPFTAEYVATLEFDEVCLLDLDMAQLDSFVQIFLRDLATLGRDAACRAHRLTQLEADFYVEQARILLKDYEDYNV